MSAAPLDDLFDPERLRALWDGPPADRTEVASADGEATAGPPPETELLARLALAFERDLGLRARKLEPLLARTRELFEALREPAAAAAAQKELPGHLNDLEDVFVALDLGSGD